VADVLGRDGAGRELLETAANGGDVPALMHLAVYTPDGPAAERWIDALGTTATAVYVAHAANDAEKHGDVARALRLHAVAADLGASESMQEVLVRAPASDEKAIETNLARLRELGDVAGLRAVVERLRDVDPKRAERIEAAAREEA
jgi:hypothetical protein